MDYTNLEARRAAAVAEARSWAGTPYVHMGMVKGPEGAADCGCFVAAVYRHPQVGVLPPDFDPRPYDAGWHLHQNEAIYLKWLAQYARPTQNPQPGDVGMYRFGKHAAHGAVLLEGDLLIHAHRNLRAVMIQERSSLDAWFHSYWDPFAVGVL